MGDVLSLDAYRSGVTLDGTALVWRGMRHELGPDRVRPFCVALERANSSGCPATGAGFAFVPGQAVLIIDGWDMGPMVLPLGDEAARFGIRLMAAARAKARAEGPVSA